MCLLIYVFIVLTVNGPSPTPALIQSLVSARAKREHETAKMTETQFRQRGNYSVENREAEEENNI